MKKLFLTLSLSLWLGVTIFVSESWAPLFPPTRARWIRTNTSNFDTQLSTSDITVQIALETLDEFDVSSSTCAYAIDSDKWDGYEFVDYLDQSTQTSADVTFASVTADTMTVNSQLVLPDSTVMTSTTTFQPAGRQSALYIVATDGTGDYNCNGTSDETEINAALAAASAGGRVLVKAGTYTIDGIINIKNSYTTLEGEGKGTIINLDADDDMIVVDANLDGVTIKNMWIDGKNKQVGTEYGIWVGGANRYLLIQDIVMQNVDEGIMLASSSSKYNWILNNFIYNVNGIGIKAVSMSYSVIANNRIYTCTSHGIIMESSSANTIIGNFIYDVTSNGIYLYKTSHYNQVFGNVVYDTSASGISLWYSSAASAPDENSIFGNILNTCVDGVYVASSGCDKTMIGINTFINCSNKNINDLGTNTVIGKQSPIEPESFKVFSQSGQPTTSDISTGKMAIWVDTDDGSTYLVINSSGSLVGTISLD